MLLAAEGGHEEHTAPAAATEILWAANAQEPEAQWRWMGHLVPDPPPNSTWIPKPWCEYDRPPHFAAANNRTPCFLFQFFYKSSRCSITYPNNIPAQTVFLPQLCSAPASPQDVSTHSGYHRLKPSSSPVKISRGECSVSLLECMMCFN